MSDVPQLEKGRRQAESQACSHNQSSARQGACWLGEVALEFWGSRRRTYNVLSSRSLSHLQPLGFNGQWDVKAVRTTRKTNLPFKVMGCI